MAGRPGRAAPNKIDPAIHVLKGTFRADRHKLPGPPPPEWVPTDAQMALLGPAGAALVARLRQTYVFSPIEGELVLEAAQTSDRLDALQQARVGVALATELKLDRVAQGYRRQLASVLLALKVSR